MILYLSKVIIVAAGNQPGNQNKPAEAKLISKLLVEWGVSRSSIVLDSTSTNTHENAINATLKMEEVGCVCSPR